MFAAFVNEPNTDDPIQALRVGEIRGLTAPSHWVRVEVKAATINQHDVWALRGAVSVANSGENTAIGMDASGVTSDGREVIVHAVLGNAQQGGGDETLDPDRTFLPDAGYGTLAEYVLVPPENLVDKPSSLSWVEGACLPTAWLTAYRMLFTKANLRPGQTVLIQGAGGAVATAAVVLASAAGARVIVTSRSHERGKKSLEIGADEFCEFGTRLSRPVDVVVDSVGQASWKNSLGSLRPGGCLVMCGATSGFEAPTNLARVFSKQLRIIGSTMGTKGELEDLVRFVDTSNARPVIDSVEPLDQVDRQFVKLISGEAFGKLGVTI